MDDNDETISRLQLFGLTKYEAEIYLLLMKHKALRATQIRELSKVPITRVYDTAQSLIEKGLIATVNIKPRHYGILPFEDSFENLISKKREAFTKEIALLKKEHLQIIKDFSKIPNKDMPKTEEFTYTLNGKKAIIRLWHSLLHNAKKEVLIFSGDSSWIDNELPKFRSMMKKKIDIRILSNCKYKDILKKAAKTGVKIRICNSIFRGMIVDGKYLYMSKKFTSTTEDEDYSCLMTEDRGIIEAIKEYFLMKWEITKNVKDCECQCANSRNFNP